jgi:F-type H+-transporting ATPase subunit a
LPPCVRCTEKVLNSGLGGNEADPGNETTTPLSFAARPCYTSTSRIIPLEDRIRRAVTVRALPAAWVCLMLLLAVPPRAAAEPAVPHEGFNLSHVLFAEITDNVEHPYATLHLVQVGRFPLDIHVTKHFILMTLVALLVLASMIYLARKLRDPYRAPTRLQSLFESLIEYMRREAFEPVLGPEGRRYHMLCFSMFLFILYGNLLGMIPPFAPLRPKDGSELVWLGGAMTGNLATTLGLGLITFFVFNIQGMVSKGVLGYWRHLVPQGTPVWMAPITLLLEIVGIFSKTLALIMRLFANMIGGHVAILVILLLVLKFESLAIGPVAVLVDLAISALELFVAVLQAYIFAFLSALFIGLAMRKH